MLVGGLPRSSKSTKTLKTSDGGNKTSSEDKAKQDAKLKDALSKAKAIPGVNKDGTASTKIKDTSTGKIYSDMAQFLKAYDV